MHLYIDPREGSKKFLKEFEGSSEEMMLDGGDIAFWGNGPDDEPWFIGIEHKQANDVIDCIKTGRLTGTQMPAMRRMYQATFLLVEGQYQPDFNNVTAENNPKIMLQPLYRGGYEMKFGMSYAALDNFLTSMQLFCGCIVKRSRDKRESIEIIYDLYHFFQKRWEDHTSVEARNTIKVLTHTRGMKAAMVAIKPGDAEYPRDVLERSLLQIEGIGPALAKDLSGRFPTMELLLNAPRTDLGNTLSARRVYETLHGYADPGELYRDKLLAIDGIGPRAVAAIVEIYQSWDVLLLAGQQQITDIIGPKLACAVYRALGGVPVQGLVKSKK